MYVKIEPPRSEQWLINKSPDTILPLQSSKQFPILSQINPIETSSDHLRYEEAHTYTQAHEMCDPDSLTKTTTPGPNV